MLDKLISPFNYRSDSLEVLKFITELTKKHCLKREWQLIESDFLLYYSTDRIHQVKICINRKNFECEFVVMLLNDLYIGDRSIWSRTSRRIAKNVAKRCGCSAQMLFKN